MCDPLRDTAISTGDRDPPDPGGPIRLIRVKTPEEADPNGIIVTLFRCDRRTIRGWIVGPLSTIRDGGKVPYVAPSAKMLGMVAVIRADQLAQKTGLELYLVDPGQLWEEMTGLG